MFGITKKSPIVQGTSGAVATKGGSEQQAYNYVLGEMIKAAAERNRFTPDIGDLERSAFQRVFVYNQMKHGHWSQAFLPEDLVTRDATCYTDNYFVLHKKQLGQASQAIATDGDIWPLPCGATADRARVQGELYKIPSSHIPIIDTYHQNTIEFERRRVRILRPWRHIVRAKDGFPLNGEMLESFKARGIVHSMRGIGTIEAWMYIGNPDYWEKQMASLFSTVPLFTSPNEAWLKSYYAFTKKEYER